ncbi:hypothetical protein [Pseudobutyrivibrio sp. LB2011]|uniref:hypothetical protein n=1 Tax=Pseudobutyrivibrio sp. LB2011 TaxID=1408312 RepID=UPI0005D25455|nr:hypothetical protein [Pseudobutyrivibrio sp. LB2011]
MNNMEMDDMEMNEMKMKDMELLEEIRNTDGVKNADIDYESGRVRIEFDLKKGLYGILSSPSFIVLHDKETLNSMKMLNGNNAKLLYLMMKDNMRCGRFEFTVPADEMEDLFFLEDCYDYLNPVSIDRYDIYAIRINSSLKDTFIENIEEICERAYFKEIGNLNNQDFKVIKKACKNKKKSLNYWDIVKRSMEEASVVNERLWNLFSIGILRMDY